MSKSWYGHHIETIKGTDYIEYKDYLKLDKIIDKQKEVLDKIKEYINKCDRIRAYYDIKDEEYWVTFYDNNVKKDILELLEEIE